MGHKLLKIKANKNLKNQLEWTPSCCRSNTYLDEFKHLTKCVQAQMFCMSDKNKKAGSKHLKKNCFHF